MGIIILEGKFAHKISTDTKTPCNNQELNSHLHYRNHRFHLHQLPENENYDHYISIYSNS
jgi:hypothetical protein